MRVDLATKDDLLKVRIDLLNELSRAMHDLGLKIPARQYLTTREACELLKCSVKTLHTLCQEGILVPFRIKSTSYYSIAQLGLLMDSTSSN